MDYLVTGGAGFIGSKICQLLSLRGENYLAVDDLSKGSIENVIDKSRFLEIDSFIKDINEGEKRELGEFGSKISGGQMQRIAIARSIYRNKEVLVFDEATNALDKRLEEKVLENLISLADEKTLIFIAHNDTVLKFCNRVINLSDK